MQTFLPFESFEESAACLDNKRLGKQRVETLQIVESLLGISGGWVNHPATKMWRGHVNALCRYGLVCCDQWESRGFKDNIWWSLDGYYAESDETGNPLWLGNKIFHDSHKSNLYRKDPVHYAQFSNIGPDLPYFWPVK